VAWYSLSFKPSVEKDLQSIPRTFVSRIMARIDRLPADPFPPQSAKLQGAERLYRLRVGDYRIVTKSIARRSTLLFSMSAIGVTCIERFAKLDRENREEAT